MHKVTILGATGSIGQSTLDVIAQHPDDYEVVALTARKNIQLLYQQCVKFKPRYVALLDETSAKELTQRLREADIHTEVCVGQAAIIQLAKDAASDTVVAAIVGSAGLLPALAAVQAGKRVLLANKEALVMGADFFMREVEKHQAALLPVDSEHNAIFQCLPDDFLPGRSMLKDVRSLILTASGGPFRTTPIDGLEAVTPVQAVAHPKWQMGTKISVDSATLMNKGLEVIEAACLFDMDVTQIRVVIHPQSVIHSLVEFEDASVLAQLGAPDMRIPIANALAWPKRIRSGAKSLDLMEIGRLDFEAPDVKRFPCLRLAYQALKAGGTATATLNAANEVAVEAFCQSRIKFTQIPMVIDAVMQSAPVRAISCLDDVLGADKAARQLAQTKL